MSVNKVILIGNVGKDPEVKYLEKDVAYARFTLATNESYKNKSGEKVTNTEWHNIVLFGRQAELAGEYLSKGKTVFIEGRLQTQKYEKDGITRYNTEVIGEKIEFLSPKGEGGRRNTEGTSEPTNGGGSYVEPTAFNEDDIPF